MLEGKIIWKEKKKKNPNHIEFNKHVLKATVMDDVVRVHYLQILVCVCKELYSTFSMHQDKPSNSQILLTNSVKFI